MNRKDGEPSNKGPLRGIVKRELKPASPFGTKVIRYLECGHAQRQPHGGKAKTATHARCVSCAFEAYA